MIVAAGRVPCINAACRRTYKQEHEGQEVICGKCFKSLPAEIRNAFRRHWREYRKWERRISRTSDELKIRRMNDVLGRFANLIDRDWEEIKRIITAPEKPVGLETFLEELGL